MQEKEISQAVIRRMPRYYRYLGELLDAGVERISSNDLSKRMNVTASQIRQDLNNFGGVGALRLVERGVGAAGRPCGALACENGVVRAGILIGYPEKVTIFAR